MGLDKEREVRKVFYDKDFIPKNVEELYNSGWREYILFQIRKYSLSDVTNSTEDLLQDILTQLIATNYLEKFDPEVAEFTVYLHTFIRNFMTKPYNKEHKTKNGANIVNYVGIVASVDDSDIVENNAGRLISMESLPDVTSDFTDYVCLVNSIESDLENIKTHSKVDYDSEIKRDTLTVYKMLSAGYEIKDIAEVFGTSKQFVYSLRKKITGIIESY